MNMIDQVARRLNPRAFEIFAANPTGSLERGLAMVQMAVARTDARAAIEAMREPTEAMLEASNREWDGRMSYRSSGAWQAMIDAALAPSPQESADV